MQWVKEEDRNTKFLYSYFKERRIKLRINEINNYMKEIFQDTNKIEEEDIKTFKRQFTEESRNTNYSMLEVIPKTIPVKQN